MDILVLMLQILMLGITLERRSVKSGDEAVPAVEAVATEPRQDHDSEERGMLRQDLGYTEEIELRDMHHASSGRTGGDEDRERDELLDPDTGAGQHPLDPYHTGEQVIANMHILDAIRAQWQAAGVTAGDSGASAVSGAQAAAVAAATGRNSTYRLGEGTQTNS